MQRASGLTADEYAYVLKAAQDYVAADADIEQQIREWNKTVLGDGGSPPPPSVLSSAAYRSELARLFALRQATMESAISNLKEQLGAERAEVLEVYLQGAFSNPKIGAAPAAGSSISGQATAPAARSETELHAHADIPSLAQSYLTESSENITFGYSPICENFTSYPGQVSSVCMQGTLSYLGPADQVEAWAYITWNNVYGYDGYTSYPGMTENGNAMPSPFYNCSSSFPCDVNLSYGSNVQYYFNDTVILYYFDGCNGPCSVVLGADTLASVFIGSTSISSLSQTQFQFGQSGSYVVEGAGFASPFENPPTYSDMWGCFSTTSIALADYSSSPQWLRINYTTIPMPSQTQGSLLSNCGSDEFVADNGFVTAGMPISLTPPPPSITDSNGNPITSSSSSPIQVLAGQPISLSVSAPTGSGLSISSQMWSLGNDTVAGFNASAASGCYVPVTTSIGPGGCANSNFSAAQISVGPFFFIVPGAAETVTVNVTYSNGLTASATEWYSVGGPTGSTLPSVFVQQNDTATVVTDTAGNPNPTANPAYLVMGNAPGQPSRGIWFNDPAIVPQGQFIWVQILNSVTYSQLFQANQGYGPPTDLGFGLDGIYPYPSGGPNSPSTSTGDSPARQDLYSYLGEAAESFDATMYVLWDPAVPPAGQQTCTPAWTDTTTRPYYTSNPSTCASIPVPLASVSWAWKPCVINALAPARSGFTPSWFTQCGPGSYSAPVLSGYPEWGSCDASQKANCQR